MKIAFFNHDKNPDIDSVMNLLKRLFSGDEITSITSITALSEPNAPRVCVFHGWPDDWQDTALQPGGNLDRTPGLIVCSISTSPLGQSVRWIQGKDVTHLLFKLPSLSGAGLTTGCEQQEENWKNFLNALGSVQSRMTSSDRESLLLELDRFLNPNPEAPLAFRLLCEATKVVEEENTKRTANGEQTSNTALLSNITIHAPSNPAEWLAPFGKKPDEAKAIEYVAGLIGSDKVKARAEAVLKAVNGNGETLQKRIGEFLNPPPNPPAQS
jgi:hypothetical protein